MILTIVEFNYLVVVSNVTFEVLCYFETFEVDSSTNSVCYSLEFDWDNVEFDFLT